MNKLEKYKEVLKIIHDNDESSLTEIFNKKHIDQQILLESLYYGINNGILNTNTVHVICNGSGQPCGSHISGYPFTNEGEDWIKSETEKQTEILKTAVLKESGKIISKIIWGIILLGIGVVIGYFIHG